MTPEECRQTAATVGAGTRMQFVTDNAPCSTIPSLQLHLDASTLAEAYADGDAIDARGWKDSSGWQNHADNVHGLPVWRSASQQRPALVEFDGNSRLWTSTDFRAVASSYTVALVARYSGTVAQSRRVLASQGSDWTVGFAGGSTSSFIAGQTLFQDLEAHDDALHVYIATMTDAKAQIGTGRRASLWKDGQPLLTDHEGATALGWGPGKLELGGQSKVINGLWTEGGGSACKVSSIRGSLRRSQY